MPDLLPIRITVCGFAELVGECRVGPSHVPSLLDPDVAVPPEFGSFAENQRLELRFHDIIGDEPGMRPPEPGHIFQLLHRGRNVLTGAADDRHLLIHCHAGFSRSPAAFAVLLAQAQPSPAEAIAAEVLRVRPSAWPNLRIRAWRPDIGSARRPVKAASAIYWQRLEQQRGLAELIFANGRRQEVEAGRGGASASRTWVEVEPHLLRHARGHRLRRDRCAAE
jgi:predicted protein tyrosine phosphatase